MDNLKIVGAPLPDMPWEDRPEGSKEVFEEPGDSS